MVKKGELFPDEKVEPKDGSPGTVGNDEILERRLPGGAPPPDGQEMPKAAFTRDDLQSREGQGGASVHRKEHLKGAVGGRRGQRGTIQARTGDIRDQVDESGNRKWHVKASPQRDDPSHAEIYRDPQGTRPTARDRDEFLGVWETIVSALRSHKSMSPHGRAEVSAVGDGGMRLQWVDGHGNSKPVGQVESVHQAVQALIDADVIRPEDADQEKGRLQEEVARLREAGYDQEAGWQGPSLDI